ncbi:MAG: ribosome-associated translation inhibitor RaiA [Aerococcus sp.]|nr:ribosome-associated translation inhibitor RaiA [Aerococcus sp.]
MFTYNVRGENIEITPAIRDYAENKISKIEKYFQNEPDITVYVNAKVYRNGDAKAEVTVPMPRLTLRAEETSQDLYGSLDLVVDKLERQVKKYKTKVNRKSREKGFPEMLTDQPAEADDNEEDIKIVRHKTVGVKPMSAEEAILQMEMLGHAFFVFRDAETEEVAVVYKRHSGDYGLIDVDTTVGGE